MSLSELNILQQFIKAQMHSMFLEKSSKIQKSFNFSAVLILLIARQRRFNSLDFKASSILFWQNLWQVQRFSLLPIHSNSGTFFDRDGSNSSNFIASSLLPIQIDLCAIYVKETPFQFQSFILIALQMSSQDSSLFCTLQHAQSVQILTLKFWSFLRQLQISKARQCSLYLSKIFSSWSSPINLNCSYVMYLILSLSRLQILSNFVVSQISLLLMRLGGRKAFPQVAAFISCVIFQKFSQKRAEPKHCYTALLSLSLSLRIWSSWSGSQSSKAAQAAFSKAPGWLENVQKTQTQAGGISLMILFSFFEIILVPSIYSLRYDHFSLSPLSFSILTMSPAVEQRYSSWFWNWMMTALLPHHLMSSGCCSRQMCTPSFTKGSQMNLNLLLSRVSELIEGAMISLYAKPQGIGAGSFSPLAFLFLGIASVGFSLKRGSAEKQATYLEFGESPEMNLMAFKCGNLDSAICPPLSWLQNTLLHSFSTTWMTPAVGCVRCSSTFSEMITFGENTRQCSGCLLFSPSLISFSTLANSYS